MADIQKDRQYTKDHEWVLKDENDSSIVAVGISDYAQSQLGDVVMVELPEVGDSVDQDEVCGAVESPKSVSDIFSPVTGEIVAVNEELLEQPELVNAQPYSDGWMFKIKVADGKELEQLLDPAAYQSLLDDAE
jgi:glycine cleavage system H protein